MVLLFVVLLLVVQQRWLPLIKESRDHSSQVVVCASQWYLRGRLVRIVGDHGGAGGEHQERYTFSSSICVELRFFLTIPPAFLPLFFGYCTAHLETPRGGMPQAEDL